MRLVPLLLLSGCCAFSAPTWHGPASSHFDGERFQRPDSRELPGGRSFVRWRMERDERQHWKGAPDAQPGPRPPVRVGVGELRVTFVNHATVLIQADGLNVLTDPIWSDRCSPVSFLGPARVRPPGLRFEDLPPIDAVLLSHNHYDHLDLPTLRRLSQAFPRARFFAGLGNGPVLKAAHLRHVQEVDWWDEVRLGRSTLIAVPAQHFSNRGLCDRDGTLFLGYVLRGPAGQAYFAGDTGYSPHFKEIRDRLGPIRLAVLPIGAYKPEWFMSPVHMSPAEAVKARDDLEAGTSVAMHFGTFALADDGEDEPPRALAAALAVHPPVRFWVLGFGEGRDVPP